jgi:hypothetical protein
MVISLAYSKRAWFMLTRLWPGLRFIRRFAQQQTVWLALLLISMLLGWGSLAHAQPNTRPEANFYQTSPLAPEVTPVLRADASFAAAAASPISLGVVGVVLVGVLLVVGLVVWRQR